VVLGNAVVLRPHLAGSALIHLQGEQGPREKRKEAGHGDRGAKG